MTGFSKQSVRLLAIPFAKSSILQALFIGCSLVTNQVDDVLHNDKSIGVSNDLILSFADDQGQVTATNT